ncbi:hypothetical protein Nmel_001339, partial [Mimus melanotis]
SSPTAFLAIQPPPARRLLGLWMPARGQKARRGLGGARGAAGIVGPESSAGTRRRLRRALCRAGAECRCRAPSAPLPSRRILTGLVPSRDFQLPLKFKSLIFLAPNPPPGKGRSLSPRPEGGARRPGATQPRRTHRPPRLINTGTRRDGTARRRREGQGPGPRRAGASAPGRSGKCIPGRAPRGPARFREAGMRDRGAAAGGAVSAGAALHTDNSYFLGNSYFSAPEKGFSLPLTGAQGFISYRCEAPKPETPISKGTQGDEVFRTLPAGAVTDGLWTLSREQRGHLQHGLRARRVQTLRHAFLELQKTLPSVPPDTKLSKLDVLLLATTYIAHLTRSLQDEEETPGEGLGTLRGDGYLHPVKVGELRSSCHLLSKWPMRSRLYIGATGQFLTHSAQGDSANHGETSTSSQI